MNQETQEISGWLEKVKPKVIGGLWSFFGFWLSPLSWWNDLWVNVPIAYGIAWVVDIFYRPVFLHTFIFSYWATNIIGLLMLGKGIGKIRKTKVREKRFSYKKWLFYLGVVLFYTMLLWVFVKFEIITPSGDFLKFY